MCKLLIMSGIQDSKNAQSFAHEIAAPMSISNNDGLGYAAIQKNGKFFWEKWLVNSNAFKKRRTNRDDELLKKLGGFVTAPTSIGENSYATSGEQDWSSVNSILMHTRLATCGKEFKNTHPFIVDDTFLIHNGRISNHEKFDKKVSTCDSEAILTAYIEEGVAKNPEKIEDLIKRLEGYWAVAVSAIDAEGKRIIDVFKNASASLCVTTIDQIGGTVFCTTEKTITDAIDKLGWDHDNSFLSIEPHVLTRFDAVTGEVIKQVDYTKLGKKLAGPTTTLPIGRNGNTRTRTSNYGNDYTANNTARKSNILGWIQKEEAVPAYTSTNSCYTNDNKSENYSAWDRKRLDKFAKKLDQEELEVINDLNTDVYYEYLAQREEDYKKNSIVNMK